MIGRTKFQRAKLYVLYQLAKFLASFLRNCPVAPSRLPTEGGRVALPPVQSSKFKSCPQIFTDLLRFLCLSLKAYHTSQFSTLSSQLSVAHRRQQAASSRFKRSGAAGSRFKCATARSRLPTDSRRFTQIYYFNDNKNNYNNISVKDRF